jgi:hypothetical protein
MDYPPFLAARLKTAGRIKCPGPAVPDMTYEH